MSPSDRPLIAIIGGGASGTLLAWNLRRLHVRAQIIIIDPADRPAVGLAYSTLSSCHFLNVPAGGMSADPGDPGHFLRWLRKHHDPDVTSGQFMERVVFGRYLSGLWAQARPEWRQTRVLSCERVAGRLELTLEDGDVIRADQVVLATGNYGPAPVARVTSELARSGRYHSSGWDNGFYERVGPEDAVVLIGTGLTSLDVLMRLRENGHRGRVVALSRHGWCPERHAPSFAATTDIIPEETPAAALAYFRAFRSSLACGISWRSAVDALRPRINLLWQALDLAEKKRFRRHLQRRWDIVRHRIAPDVADFMGVELENGTLVCWRGQVTRLDFESAQVFLQARCPAGVFTLSADHVVNCTGPSRSYDQMPDTFPYELLRTGMVRGTALGGLHCRDDGALTDAGGQCFGDLFALGPMRWGTLFETTAIPEIRRQAADLAALLTERCGYDVQEAPCNVVLPEEGLRRTGYGS
ncbi:FAD/NAD(P)-binding protein [Gluconobacter kondonii]|uniref:FAD/NAD(P)-binding protein n=1 Tax=Gluconobacter kondonii TaxID=941463 RepID=UPI001B8DA07B|nr:FAD/NAD(P)-binding protein [Gluconobacter kondonii]MBS1082125.1 FAD/NAD(P)-binding protein [Gluconobacter kondonii]